MIRIRPAAQRGHADYGWLKTSHSFSFDTYYDPAHLGFRSLRVINQDVVMHGQGFGMHGHRDMEIVTYVIEGALEHRDSLGNGGMLKAGELQRMTAGTGIRHSESNPSAVEPLHLYQIWLIPDRPGHVPSYEQASFEPGREESTWRLVAAPDGKEGSLTNHQDVQILHGWLQPGEPLVYTHTSQRHYWVQVVRGTIRLAGQALGNGDGAAASGEPSLRLEAQEPAQVLLFDLA
jgi:redox-sensitive bicupin YhaK (pirin superfamily)